VRAKAGEAPQPSTFSQHGCGWRRRSGKWRVRAEVDQQLGRIGRKVLAVGGVQLADEILGAEEGAQPIGVAALHDAAHHPVVRLHRRLGGVRGVEQIIRACDPERLEAGSRPAEVEQAILVGHDGGYAVTVGDPVTTRDDGVVPDAFPPAMWRGMLLMSGVADPQGPADRDGRPAPRGIAVAGRSGAMVRPRSPSDRRPGRRKLPGPLSSSARVAPLGLGLRRRLLRWGYRLGQLRRLQILGVEPLRPIEPL